MLLPCKFLFVLLNSPLRLILLLPLGLHSRLLFVRPLLLLPLILLRLLEFASLLLFVLPLPRLRLILLPLPGLASPFLFVFPRPPLCQILLPLLGLASPFLFALPLPPLRLILLPFLGLASLRLPRRPRQRPLPEHVHVQTRNALARVRAAIDHDPVAGFQQVQLLRHSTRREQQLAPAIRLQKSRKRNLVAQRLSLVRRKS